MRSALVAALVCALLAAVGVLGAAPAARLPRLSRERMVFQTKFGDIHMALFPDIAPKSANHIRRLVELGCYNTNHFFRVDKGFVAQTADVPGGRAAPLDDLQRSVASLHVPLEVVEGVKHDRAGILSMARHSDPNSGGSSFSILLGPAPHLDMQYTIFGIVTRGYEALERMQELETRKEGIFVMPVERVGIASTYVYVVDEADSQELDGSKQAQHLCTEELADLQSRYNAQSLHVEKMRQQKLPGR